MGQYPNQKRIIIHRENIEKGKGNTRPFLIAYQDNLIYAMKLLTPAEFKVYLCLLFNKEGYSLDFSPEHIHEITGVCKDTIRKALNRLEELGFLEYDGNSKYEFYESYSLPRNKYNISY